MLWNLIDVYAIFCSHETKRKKKFFRKCRSAGIPDSSVHIISGEEVHDTSTAVETMGLTILPGCEHHFKNPGHLGCALSHLKVWECVQESRKAFALIVESDVEFPKHFTEDFQAAMNDIPNDFDLVWLYRYPTTHKNDVFVNENTVIPGPTSSTACYLLTTDAARKLCMSRYREQMCCVTVFLSSTFCDDVRQETARDMFAQTVRPDVCKLTVYSPSVVLDVHDAFLVEESSTDGV